jgi:hypothetical protein
MTKYKEITIDVKVSPEVIINEALKRMLQTHEETQEQNIEEKEE